MATRADIELVRKALAGLSDRAKADLVDMWSAIDHTDYRQVRRLVAQFWPMLVGKYGDIASALAADMFQLQAEVLGIKARLEVADGVNPARANARANWALTQPDQFGNLVVLLDELVKQPYRSTFQDSAVKSGAAWARVPSGSTTCAFCLMLASRGAVYHTKQTAGGRGKKFHGECVLPGTVVHGPAAKVALRRQYEGEIVEISTAGGHNLAVTPNHPILTRRGWVAAGALSEGDDLLASDFTEPHVGSGPDIDDPPAFVEDRFRALSMVATAVSGRVPGAPEQFHGDGRESEVDVVARDSLLWDEVEASFGKGIAEGQFPSGPAGCPIHGLSLDGLRSGEVVGGGPSGPANGVMRRSSLLRTLLGSHAGCSDQTGFGPTSNLNAALNELPPDRRARDPEGLGEGVLTFAGEISGDYTFRHIERTRAVRTDSVTVIAWRFYSGHVYNLTTVDGWYFANSIVTHNCDCTVVLVRDERDYPPGYDPDGLYQDYLDARAASASDSTSSILSEMRDQLGTN